MERSNLREEDPRGGLGRMIVQGNGSGGCEVWLIQCPQRGTIMANNLSSGTMRSPQHGREDARGFSLVELLVVIAVLGILIALTMTLAGGVTSAGKSRAATDTIRVLDQSVEAWTTASGDKVPKSYEGFKIVDGTWTVNKPGDWPELVPSLSLYIAAVSQEANARGAIESLDPGIRNTEKFDTASLSTEIVKVRDPWGNEFRFVHPAYDGGWGDYYDGSMVQTRGALSFPSPDMDAFTRVWRPDDGLVGDADEGICPGGGTRAYFYSAGPDGDPGTIADNVYSERPEFPAETADIRN